MALPKISISHLETIWALNIEAPQAEPEQGTKRLLLLAFWWRHMHFLAGSFGLSTFRRYRDAPG
jgi:hypothetical protein